MDLDRKQLHTHSRTVAETELPCDVWGLQVTQVHNSPARTVWDDSATPLRQLT